MSLFPPHFDSLPQAVQSALRLRGALVPCGNGVRGVAWPETPTVRLSTLASVLAPDLVASFMTAAWVWGAHPAPPMPHSVSSNTRRNQRQSSSSVSYSELRLVEGDMKSLGVLRVTTPSRTLFDLLARRQPFTQEEFDACVRLAESIGESLPAFETQLSKVRRPHVILARQRLREVALRTSTGSRHSFKHENT